jgi:NitT/TauT family transport system substrate-binding protein
MPLPGRIAPFTRLGRRGAMAVLALATLAGCSALGSESSDQGSGNRPAGSPEKAKIKVAMLPTMDAVPLYLAQDEGLFKQEGLEVETVNAASGSDTVAKLVSGAVDFAFSSYTPFFAAKENSNADIKLVADATSSNPGYAVVATMPNSQTVKNIRDLGGKRIAITAKFTMSHLLVASQLKVNGIDPDGVKWVEMPFPKMADALAKNQVDAALLVEPYVQQAAKSIGATILFDSASGPTADIPLTGYGATSKFINENPRTLAAFQRVMKKATDEAHGDRTKVDPVVQKIAKIDADTAHLTVLTNFVSSLDPVRLQRVVDLMVEFKALPSRFDVSTMIVRPPAT